MNKVNYNHRQNIHSQETPEILLPIMFDGLKVSSFLDVGAGTGVWINAAKKNNIGDSIGIDGIILKDHDLKCKTGLIDRVDLTNGFMLGRTFDVALCLEVAEHLPSLSAARLIESITHHTTLCFFSAAIPGQDGQNHINCQWPEYWQNLFNKFGFECADDIRSKIWNLDVDPWYKQNMFKAFKSENAGLEPRIHSLIHPEMLKYIRNPNAQNKSFIFRFIGKLNKTFDFKKVSY